MIMLLSTFVGVGCFLATGSFLCNPQGLMREVSEQAQGALVELEKEIQGRQEVMGNKGNHLIDVQADMGQVLEEVIGVYRLTDYEVLLCSWCTVDQGIFLLTTSGQGSVMEPSGTRCTSLQELEEFTQEKTPLFGLAFSSHLQGCYHSKVLNLYHLNNTEIPKALTSAYGTGLNLISEVKDSMNWLSQTEFKVIPLESTVENPSNYTI